jgi:amidohydrolase
MTAFSHEVASEVVGPGGVRTLEAMMGSEDMAYFLQAAPGCFLFLGSANAGKGLSAPHHSPQFDFDEACLPIGVQLLVRLVERALEAR